MISQFRIEERVFTEYMLTKPNPSVVSTIVKKMKNKSVDLGRNLQTQYMYICASRSLAEAV